MMTAQYREVIDIEEGKGFADSTTISEAINVLLLRRGGPLNAASLNSDMLNA